MFTTMKMNSIRKSAGSVDIADLENTQMKTLIRNELILFWNDVARSDLEQLTRHIDQCMQRLNNPDRVKEDFSRASARVEKRKVTFLNVELGDERQYNNDGQMEDWPAVLPESKISDAPQRLIPHSSREMLPCEQFSREGTRATNSSDEVCPLLRVEGNCYREPLVARFHAQLQNCHSSVKQFVVSMKFDLIVAVLIAINAFSVGVQLNLRAQGWTADQLPFFNILNRILHTAFYVEIGLRAFAYRPTFYKYVRRNLLDVSVITFMFASDVCAMMGQLHGLGWRLYHANAFSVIRMVRNFRLLRIIRDPTIMRVCRHLRVFAASVEDSLSTLGAAMIYMFLLNYGISVLLTTTVADYLQNHSLGQEEFEELLLVRFFSSVPDAMLSLWEITLDGYVYGMHWGRLLSEFYDHRPLWVSVLFIGYVSVTKLGVLTVITGIFTTCAMKNAEEDHMFVLESFADDFFRETDTDGDAQITWDEFRAHLGHPLLLEFFPDLANDEKSAKRLFSMIDVDGSGACSVHELIGMLAKRSKGHVRFYGVSEKLYA